MAEARFLLDSNIVIYILKGVAPLALARIEASELGSIVTSAIALGEIIVGLKPNERPALDALLAQIAVLPFDDAAAKSYGELPFERRSYDRLIAAHALTLDLIVVTSNRRDFADVPRLLVEDWMT